MGAVRLLAALAAKSQKAQDVLDALQAGAADALRELGFANAAKDASDANALAAFVPVLETDDAADEDADDETTGQVVEALDALVETTKSLGQGLERMDARLSAMENRTGTSFGRDWDDSDDGSDMDVTMKSNGNDLWAGSAFALQA